MIKHLERIQMWFALRGPRERIFLFLLALLIIYLLMISLVLKPIVNAKKEVKNHLSELQAQLEAHRQQINAIQNAVKSGNLKKPLEQQARLTQVLSLLNQQFSQLKPAVLSLNDVSSVTKNIINVQQPQVKLINIKKDPPQPWAPPELKDKMAGPTYNTIYELDFEMVFEGNYFGTLEYFSRLEKISPAVYWDKMDYQVSQYPLAKVTVRFHLLTNQKS